MPSSRGSSQPQMEPRSPALQVDSLSSEPPGKPLMLYILYLKYFNQKKKKNLLYPKEKWRTCTQWLNHEQVETRSLQGSPGSPSSTSPEDLLEQQTLGPCSRSTESETLQLGPAIRFKKRSRWRRHLLKSENPWTQERVSPHVPLLLLFSCSVVSDSFVTPWTVAL